jgi:anti-sigma factor RsiW
VADLLYTRDHGLPVALCIGRDDDAAEAPPKLASQHALPVVRVEKSGGQRLAYWERDGYTFVVVGDLSAADAGSLADRAAAQIND